MSNFDPSNPPAQPDAAALLAEVAKALGADPTDGAALTTALASLIEAAGVGSDPTAPSDDPKKASNERPLVVNAAAVRRGREIMSGAKRAPTTTVSAADVAEGARRLGWPAKR